MKSMETAYEVILKEFGLDVVLKIHEARVAAMCTKIKMRNMTNSHKDYENFHDRVAKKHNLDRRWFDVLLEVSVQEMHEEMAPLGGCKEADYAKLFEMIRDIIGLKDKVNLKHGLH